jgi:dephospho-CoA kinase
MFQVYGYAHNLLTILLKRMIKLGLTGGIGSGKSTIARLFGFLGIPVFDSDSIAKNLYLTDSELKSSLIHKFGPEVYLSSGQINKAFLISNVFNNRSELEELNAIVHPRVKASFEEWVMNNSSQPILLKEAAILFESGADKQLDLKIVVVAPVETRISRVIARDKTEKCNVLSRMKNQWPEEELIKRADFVIDNSGRISVLEQVLYIHKNLCGRVELKKKRLDD